MQKTIMEEYHEYSNDPNILHVVHNLKRSPVDPLPVIGSTVFRANGTPSPEMPSTWFSTHSSASLSSSS
jgi:hypothetical protein